MFFLLNHRNIDISLLLRRCSLMILWRDIFETLIFSMPAFLIFNDFVVLTPESRKILCCFIDDSLMILWRTIEVTAKISWQTLKIIIAFLPILRNIDVWLMLCRWSLMILWRDVLETLIIEMENILIFIVFFVLPYESLMFHRWFVDDSLMNHWSYSENFVWSINDL